MPFGLGYFRVMEQARRRAKWSASGPVRIEIDATLSFGDVKLPVHSMVLGAESQRFREMFEAQYAETGNRDISLRGANVHAVWRTLELIYCRKYNSFPCPRTILPDDDHEFNQHVSVYQLAQYLGLSESLIEIPFGNFKSALQKDWTSEDFLLAMSTLVIPVLPGHSQIFSKSKIREDRVVKLMIATLHEQRERFEDIFLDLFFEKTPFRELLEHSYSKLLSCHISD